MFIVVIINVSQFKTVDDDDDDILRYC